MKYALPLLFFFLSTEIAVGQTAAATYDMPEAYAVYAALLSDTQAKKLVIQIETEDFPRIGGGSDECLVAPKGEENVYASAIADYKAVNKKAWLLQRKFDMSNPYELISKSSFAAIFGKDVFAGWREFDRRYPGANGITTLSPVGFNADKTIAIVYLGNQCGGLCGGGTHYALQKKDGKWTKSKAQVSQCFWAS